MFIKSLNVFVVLLFLTAVMANPFQSRSTAYYLAYNELEEPCVRQGGICMPINDCDPGNLVQVRGVLCPTQRHLAVECCYN